MLIKALENIIVQTLKGKEEVKKGEVVEVNPTIYASLKSNYKSQVEFLPCFVIAKGFSTKIGGVECKDGVPTILKTSDYNSMKTMYKNEFIFIESKEMYEKYILETGKTIEQVEVKAEKKAPIKSKIKK